MRRYLMMITLNPSPSSFKMFFANSWVTPITELEVVAMHVLSISAIFREINCYLTEEELVNQLAHSLLTHRKSMSGSRSLELQEAADFLSGRQP
jgi:hypothetical protein